MESIKINSDGSVTVNGQIATYDNLLENISPVGEYKTGEGKTLVLFPFEEGFIEVVENEVKFSVFSFEALMDRYYVQ